MVPTCAWKDRVLRGWFPALAVLTTIGLNLSPKVHSRGVQTIGSSLFICMYLAVAQNFYFKKMILP